MLPLNVVVGQIWGLAARILFCGWYSVSEGGHRISDKQKRTGWLLLGSKIRRVGLFIGICLLMGSTVILFQSSAQGMSSVVEKLPSVAGTSDGDAAALVNDAYILGSGDKVRVTVFGHEDLSGEFDIDGRGTIAMPLIGDIVLGGGDIRQGEAAVIGKLSPVYLKNPRVNLEVLNYRPFYILGEVKRPGSYPFVDGLTMIQAVALAGGFTYRAKKDDIELTRNDREKTTVMHSTPVLPGDVIDVPERYF